jgi:hypothetical protein
MATRTIKAERRWRRIVKDWRQSGLSAPQYAKGRGISAGMIYVWSSRLAKQDADAIAAELPSTFLPVAIVEQDTASLSERSSALEVVLPGGELIRVADLAAS